jgi:hypothetical protein
VARTTRRLDIEIETDERLFEHELFESENLERGQQLTLSDGTTVTYNGTLMRKAVGFSPIVKLAVDLASAIGTGVASSWLYDKLKGKPAKLRINRKEIELTPERIRIVIEEIEREG